MTDGINPFTVFLITTAMQVLNLKLARFRTHPLAISLIAAFVLAWYNLDAAIAFTLGIVITAFVYFRRE